MSRRRVTHLAASESSKQTQPEKGTAADKKLQPSSGGESFATDEADSQESEAANPESSVKSPTNTRLRIGAQAAEKPARAQDKASARFGDHCTSADVDRLKRSRHFASSYTWNR